MFWEVDSNVVQIKQQAVCVVFYSSSTEVSHTPHNRQPILVATNKSDKSHVKWIVQHRVKNKKKNYGYVIIWMQWSISCNKIIPRGACSWASYKDLNRIIMSVKKFDLLYSWMNCTGETEQNKIKGQDVTGIYNFILVTVDMASKHSKNLIYTSTCYLALDIPYQAWK